MKNLKIGIHIISCAILSFIILTAGICAGTLDSDTAPCSTKQEGELVFQNNTNETRNFFLNNSLQVTVKPHAKSGIFVKRVGSYSIRVENAFNSQDVSCAVNISVEKCKKATYACPY